MADEKKDFYGLKEVKIRLKLEEGETAFPDRPINDPGKARVFAQDLMRDLDREWVMVVNLDYKLRPINYNIVSIGTINRAPVSISNIYKAAILSNAYGEL